MNSCLLEVKAPIWAGLVADLRRRGGGKRESGAFLLGTVHGQVRRISTWVPYDVLDPEALSKGYVRLGTHAFTALWAKCSELGLAVVADVHTHPEGPRQSRSDKVNPMIAQVGHVALIVPDFARGDGLPSSISVNVYQGAKQWKSYFAQDAERLIRFT